MAISKTRGAFSAWTAVAMGAVSKGAIINTSLHYTTSLHIQAFLDTVTATAHTGTEVKIQKYTGPDPANVVDEYWADYLSWDILVGTCNPEPQLHLTDPSPLGATVFPVTSTTGYVVADAATQWVALQDPSPNLATSELLQLTSIAGTALTVLDGATRTHPKTTAIFGSVAYSYMTPPLPTKDIMGLRVIFNNDKDSNGAIINCRFAWTANLK